MELKNFMKEVTGILIESKAKKASLQLHLNLENEKIEVAPYGSNINFTIEVEEAKR